jgi:hypothetical protein
MQAGDATHVMEGRKLNNIHDRQGCVRKAEDRLR